MRPAVAFALLFFVLAVLAPAAARAEAPDGGTRLELLAGYAAFDRALSGLRGVAYGARAVVPLDESWLALDVGFQGSSLRGNPSTGFVHARGAWAGAQVGLPTRIEPYLFAGVGVLRTSPPEDDPRLVADTAVMFPFGVGLETVLATHLVVGARAGYALLLGNRVLGDAATPAGLFKAEAVVGFRF